MIIIGSNLNFWEYVNFNGVVSFSDTLFITALYMFTLSIYTSSGDSGILNIGQSINQQLYLPKIPLRGNSFSLDGWNIKNLVRENGRES